jgi:hypothetical protein
MNTSKITTLGMVAAATIASAMVASAIAHADSPSFVFESPSGNIGCHMTTGADGTGAVACDVEDTTYAPPRSPDCHQGWGDPFSLDQGSAPNAYCHTDVMVPGTPPGHGRAVDVLGYGQTRSVGAITCDSEPAGITCTDASTGHYFRVSPESYEFG